MNQTDMQSISDHTYDRNASDERRIRLSRYGERLKRLVQIRTDETLESTVFPKFIMKLLPLDDTNDNTTDNTNNSITDVD